MMNEGDGGAFCWGNGPTAAQKVYLAIGIDPAAQMKRQVQVQQGRGRARPYGRAMLLQGLVPSRIGAQAGGAADGGILVGDLAIQYALRSRVIADVFISQERYQALLEGSKTAFDLAFGLGAGGDQMGHSQGGEGALKLRAGVTIVGHGIMAKEAQAIGVDDQGQGVVEKEPAKVLEMIPGGIGGDKDRAQEFSRVIIDGQEQGLLVGGRPPLMDGGIVLPEFAQAGPLPAAAGFGARFGLAEEIGEMGSHKGRHRLPMALEAEAQGQFIGRQLKVGRFLQRDKRFEEPGNLRRPIGPVVAPGELGAERRAVLQPATA